MELNTQKRSGLVCARPRLAAFAITSLFPSPPFHYTRKESTSAACFMINRSLVPFFDDVFLVKFNHSPCVDAPQNGQPRLNNWCEPFGSNKRAVRNMLNFKLVFDFQSLSLLHDSNVVLLCLLFSSILFSIFSMCPNILAVFPFSRKPLQRVVWIFNSLRALLPTV